VLSRKNDVRRSFRARELGSSLVVTLLMIVVVASLAIASARFALSGESSSRNDRDRNLALLAAETALADGVKDVMSKKGINRGDDFCGTATFPGPNGGCIATGADRGKCGRSSAGNAPSWLTVNWSTAGVPVGTFTGGTFYPTRSTDKSWLPVNDPRYVIEPTPDFGQEMIDGFKVKDGSGFMFIVTAVGYATRADTKVVLQQIVRKPSC
jgi:type IV pilus assembly protein PilX